MNNSELLRLIDAISRDRNVEKDLLFDDLEQALVSGARKHFQADEEEEFTCEIDRFTGQISVWRQGEPISLEELGRIPAQTAKQVMIQRFREDERASIYNEFIDRVGDLATGTAQRYEGGALIVQIGRAEGFMPRREQIPGEQHQPGERVRCLILDVRDEGNQVKIVLSRAAPEMIRRLFEVEVPEVAERIIEIRAMAREPGARTKLAVQSMDSKVDAVGACVGVRGSRIKNIVDELGGEKIDIVRWNESSQMLIANALKPAEVVEISLCFELGRATVVVNEDQLSLAIGKRGQNVRLAARLTNWDVDILTPQEYTKSLDILEQLMMSIEGVQEDAVDRLAALGLISVFDVEEVGPEFLTEQLELEESVAVAVCNAAAEKGKIVAEEQAKEKAIQEKARKEAAAAQAAGLGTAGVTQEAATQAADILGEKAPTVPPTSTSAAGESSLMDLLGGSASKPEADVDAARPDDPAAITPVTDAVAKAEATDPDPAGGVPIDADPTAGGAADLMDKEAAQQGSTAEMLADKTDAVQGSVMIDPDAAEQPASAEASAEKP
jgi:N utilization substance protein A